MPIRNFLVTLLAINLSFHLLRFPHLILENGGGAFLILFFIVLNLLALPLIICERILDTKLGQIDLNSLLKITKSGKKRSFESILFFLWYGIRIFILVCFLLLFLFLSGRAAHYVLYYLGFMFSKTGAASDLAVTPVVDMSWLGSFFWVLFSFLVFFRYRTPFLKWSNRWGLPCCFAILFVLFMKIILSVRDYEALKILFYPDFSALNRHSLVDMIGHAMACLFVGLGFYRMLKVNARTDFIEIFINAVIQALTLAVLIGVMALPMIDQVSETAFGSNWIFTILPRWLSYGTHGYYYCGLFFLAISYVSFHVCVTIWRVLNHNILIVLNLGKKPKVRWIGNFLFIFFGSTLVFSMQNSLGGWAGQSLLLSMDHMVIDFGLPVIALLLIWLVFRYTKKSEQSFVFEQQQLFYHNRFFFRIWQVISLVVVPGVIALSWLLRLF